MTENARGSMGTNAASRAVEVAAVAVRHVIRWVSSAAARVTRIVAGAGLESTPLRAQLCLVRLAPGGLLSLAVSRGARPCALLFVLLLLPRASSEARRGEGAFMHRTWHVAASGTFARARAQVQVTNALEQGRRHLLAVGELHVGQPRDNLLLTLGRQRTLQAEHQRGHAAGLAAVELAAEEVSMRADGRSDEPQTSL